MAGPRPQFLRSIIFRDRTPDDSERFPIHIGNTVLLDGAEHPGLILPNYGWTAEGGSHEGTVVSMVADASRVTVGRVENGSFEAYRLDDVPVLVPRDADWTFLPADDDRPAAVQVYLYVRHFAIDSAQDDPK